MKRLVVVMVVVAALLVVAGGAEAVVEPDGVACGEIAQNGAAFALFSALLFDTGGDTSLLIGFVRRVGTAEAIPFSGSAVAGETRFTFTMSGGAANAGTFTLVGEVATGQTQGAGACFGSSPCSASGVAVTYTLTESCPIA